MSCLSFVVIFYNNLLNIFLHISVDSLRVLTLIAVPFQQPITVLTTTPVSRVVPRARGPSGAAVLTGSDSTLMRPRVEVRYLRHLDIHK